MLLQKKAELVVEYLYNYNYYRVDYRQLSKYANAASYNVYIEDFFNLMLEERKAKVLNTLSNLSLSEVAQFYKLHCAEHTYLKDVLSDIYFSNIDSLDYKTRKLLYNTFADTDLKFKISGPYFSLRDSLLSEIMESFNLCFKSEQEVLRQIENVVRYEVQQYLESGLHTIIHQLNVKNDRGLIKKIFKREAMDNSSFKKYANETINRVYDYSYVENLIKARIAEYLSSSKEIRSVLFNQYFNDFNYDNIYIPNTALQSRLLWEIGRQGVSNIQTIKNIGTALTVGSIALGFVPGLQPVAIAADVADFAYGMGQDSQVNKAMEELANSIYQDSSKCLERYISEIFSQLYENQEITANNIKKIFYDEF